MEEKIIQRVREVEKKPIQINNNLAVVKGVL